MSEYNPYEKLQLVRAARVIANEHILESLDLAHQLETSIDKHKLCLHSENLSINTDIELIIENLEKEYAYNNMMIQNIDKYLRCGHWDGDEKSLKRELAIRI